MMRSARPDGARGALLTDLYELTMLRAYWARGMGERAVFSLFVRRLPPHRNLLLACGLDAVLGYLETLHFDEDALAFLGQRPGFDAPFLRWLGALRFTGDVWALPEGTPFFAGEPLLEIEAPLPEAQLVESLVMNQLHLPTLLASKGVRVVAAAAGRPVVDFGLRRMHGMDAAVSGARALYVAGLAGTSNVLAGREYDLPLSGTMAHSFVQAHGDELEAFRAFAESWPEGVLLVDTYDTLEGVRNVVRLAGELGARFRVGGIRLDSGDLADLSRAARVLLDRAGLERLRIVASGSLDEARIAALVRSGAPIDAFGVGTRLGVSEDAPALDTAYKLVAYAGTGRMKLSPEKEVLPGAKQVFRIEAQGRAVEDVLGGRDEKLPGRPLLVPVMKGGRRTAAGLSELEAARRRAGQELERLPEAIRSFEDAREGYPVRVSEVLRARARALAGRLRAGPGAG